MTATLPSSARIVIIGGGVVGASIAWHLTEAGERDVLLLERRRLTSGTTWHAAGLVGQLRATLNLTRLAQYTTGLYARLEAETGLATGFRQRGSVSIAQTPARMEELLRGASMARTFGLEVHPLTPAEIRQHWPLLEVGDLEGGVFLPGDGQTDPVNTTLAMIKGATSRGARVLEGVEVTGLLTRRGHAGPAVTGVRVGEVEIQAEHVVLAAGMWSRAFGAAHGVSLPLQAAEHFYIVTESFPGLDPNLPVLRDPDSCAYFKEDAGKLLLGAFEPKAKPWALEGIPTDFEFTTLPYDTDHFEPILEAALHRLPALADVGIRTFFNGPESFTADNRYLLGETPEIQRLWVACGFNSIGIQSAGGAGKALAEWILAGHAPMDLADVDVRRIQPFQAGTAFLKDRVSESLGLLYAMHWPYRQYETGRGARRSPLHDRLAAAGACFGEVAGWERANWFAPSGVTAEYEYSYGRQNWFPHAAAEHLAVRNAVGLFDMTSFGKILVQGPDAEDVLARLSCSQVRVPPGRVVYTQWLNDRGGIEADLTIHRWDQDRFLVVTAGANLRRDLSWLTRHIPETARCTATDVSGGWICLPLMGPKAPALLQAVSGQIPSVPFGHWQRIEIGFAPVIAARISYVGEMGWELYAPAEFATHVFDRLMAAGPAHGLRLCGLHALDSLRIEKAYKHWGHDLGEEDTPLEAGLMPPGRLDRLSGFIGHEALLRQRDRGLTRRLVQFQLQDPLPMLYHDEPIWIGDRILGRTTSGAYGHHLGSAIALGYVQAAPDRLAALLQAPVEIEIACRRHAAHASLTPLYDPDNVRLRA